MSDVREITNKLLELAEEGLLSWQDIAEACLGYMSEDHVADMASDNYFIEDEDDEVTE